MPTSPPAERSTALTAAPVKAEGVAEMVVLFAGVTVVDAVVDAGAGEADVDEEAVVLGVPDGMERVTPALAQSLDANASVAGDEMWC